jgi:hypothetical protein
MGNLNIGLAMVAARLATSETDKEQEDTKKRESRVWHPEPGRGPIGKKTSIPGAKLEVVNGRVTLVPSVESSRYHRSKGWTLTGENRTVVRIDTGKVIRPPKPG